MPPTSLDAVFGMGSETAKRVFFEILSHVDPNIVGSRLGRLYARGRKELETPDFLAVSSRGVVPHISPDVVANTQIGGLHMALEDCKSFSCHVSTFLSLTNFSHRENRSSNYDLYWKSSAYIQCSSYFYYHSIDTSAYSCCHSSKWKLEYCHLNFHVNRIPSPLQQVIRRFVAEAAT